MGDDGNAYNSINGVMIWPNYPSAPCVHFLPFRWIFALGLTWCYPLHHGFSLAHSGLTSKTKASATKDKSPSFKAVAKHLIIAYGRCLQLAISLLPMYIVL